MGRGSVGLVVVFACTVGFLHVYPDVRFQCENATSAAESIPFWAATDEGTYLSRVARVAVGGGWRLGNVMIYEHRNDPWIYGQAGEVLEGRMAALFGQSVAAIDVWWTLLVPMVVVTLVYCWFFRLTHSTPMALLASALIVLGQYLISKDSPLLHGRLIQPEWTYPLQLVRPISPQFYIMPFLAVLWAFSELFIGGKRLWSLLAGLGEGVLFYTNLFFWGFVLVGAGLLVMLAAHRRRWMAVRGFLTAMAIASLCAIPYVSNVWQSMHHANFAEAVARLGLHASRQPILPVWHMVVSLTFLGVGWSYRRESWYPIISAFLIGGFLCLNQQLITGKVITPYHWETQTNKILVQCVLVLTLWCILRRLRQPMQRLLQAGLCIIAITTLLAHGVMLQSQYYRLNRSAFLALQPLGKPLAWLKKHTQPSDVVLVNPLHFEWADFVTAFSGNYTYFSDPFFVASFVPRSEIEERYLSALHFYRDSSKEARGFIRWFDGAHFLGLAALPWYVPANQAHEAYLRELEARYNDKQVYTAWNALRPYKLDYVLLSTNERARLAQAIPAQEIEQVYDDGAFAIWHVPRQKGDKT